MTLDTLVDNIKNWFGKWFDDRKNPFLISVLGYWIIHNRIIVFSILFFDDQMSLQQKIDFIQNQLKQEEFIYWTGFYATFWQAVIMGFIVMIVGEALITSGEIIYTLTRKLSLAILKVFLPKNFYVPKVEKDKIENDLRETNEKLSKSLDESNALRESTRTLYSEFTNHKDISSKELAEKVREIEELKSLKEKYEMIQNESMGLKILYAAYGTDIDFIEVTKIVKETLGSSEELIVSNGTFKVDPSIFKIKSLKINFLNDNVPSSISALEGSKISLNNSIFEIHETRESEANKKYQVNIKELSRALYFKGLFTKKLNGNEIQENYSINDNGDYFVDNVHTYNILVTKFGNEIELIKYNILTKRKDKEILTRNLKMGSALSGLDSEKNPIIYYPDIRKMKELLNDLDNPNT